MAEALYQALWIWISAPMAGPALFAKFTFVTTVGKPGVKDYRRNLGESWLCLPALSTPNFSAGAETQRLHKVE